MTAIVTAVVARCPVIELASIADARANACAGLTQSEKYGGQELFEQRLHRFGRPADGGLAAVNDDGRCSRIG